MINWNKTLEKFNRIDLSGHRPKVVVECDNCGSEGTKSIRKKSEVIRNQIPWECAKCVANDPEKRKASRKGAKEAWKDDRYRNKIVTNSKEIWNDPELRDRMSAFRQSDDFAERMTEINRKKVTPEFKQKMSELGKKRWLDGKYRDKMTEILGQVSKEAWGNQEYRRKISEATKKSWENPEYRAKICESLSLARDNMPKVSSIQETLYSILDDLNISYYREHNSKQDDLQTKIGPYSFDCVIPRQNAPDLLIECQGEYWHSTDRGHANDKRKASYVANNFPNQYELKCIWEHEFHNYNKVVELLKYWLGITKLNTVEYDFNNVEINDCPASEYRLLLSKYHYLSDAGRGGICYGAYLEEELIAVCVFSPLVRHNIRTGRYKKKECRELSRLCIHPRYQKKNFASWFVSRCLKKLPDKYKLIISYCDTTFNHDGAVYKSLNFKPDGDVPPSYWYTDENGWTMHKKTLYQRAVKMKMKEREYAETNGYVKVWGSKKLRFVYER